MVISTNQVPRYIKQMANISNVSIISRNENMLFSKLDDELVMMSIQNNEYYGLDNIGTRIWEIIEKPISFSDLMKIILDEYEVNENECKEDILEFLNLLMEKNAIAIK